MSPLVGYTCTPCVSVLTGAMCMKSAVVTVALREYPRTRVLLLRCWEHGSAIVLALQ